MASKSQRYFYAALLSAIWFALTSFAWTYLMNVFISFPFLLISYLCWRKGKQIDSNVSRYRFITWIWIIGLTFSASTLIYFLLFE